LKLQKTIKGEGKVAGKGLFGGEDCRVVFRPAPEDTGIVFVRTDVADAVRIAAVAPHIAERSRRTSIKKGEVSIETVEHCLAAVRALEIDNLLVEVEGPELPAPDCSSARPPIAAAPNTSKFSNAPVSSSSKAPDESL